MAEAEEALPRTGCKRAASPEEPSVSKEPRTKKNRRRVDHSGSSTSIHNTGEQKIFNFLLHWILQLILKDFEVLISNLKSVFLHKLQFSCNLRQMIQSKYELTYPKYKRFEIIYRVFRNKNTWYTLNATNSQFIRSRQFWGQLLIFICRFWLPSFEETPRRRRHQF